MNHINSFFNKGIKKKNIVNINRIILGRINNNVQTIQQLQVDIFLFIFLLFNNKSILMKNNLNL